MYNGTTRAPAARAARAFPNGTIALVGVVPRMTWDVGNDGLQIEHTEDGAHVVGARHVVGGAPRDADVALERTVAFGCGLDRASISKAPLCNRLHKKLINVVNAKLSKKLTRKSAALRASRAARGGRAGTCMRTRCKVVACRNGKWCQEKHH